MPQPPRGQPEKLESFRSLEALYSRIKELELEGASRFASTSKEKYFGVEADSNILRNHVVRFEMSASRSAAIQIEYDGIPFINVARRYFSCRWGKSKLPVHAVNRDGHGMAVTRRPNASTKKVDCPVRLLVKHIIKFPEFKLSGERTSFKMRKASKALYELVKSGKDLTGHYYNEFFMTIPSPEEHQGHRTSGVRAGFRPELDPRVVNVLKEAVQLGVTKVSDIKSIIKHYVNHDLFHGQKEKPHRLDKKYYPTLVDIAKYVERSILSRRDKANTEKLVTMWQHHMMEDFIFFRGNNDGPEIPYKAVAKHLPGTHMKVDIVALKQMSPQKSGPPLIFCYQSKWQKRLMSLFGNQMTYLDPVYLSLPCVYPLYFLTVLTNVGYMIVGVIILEQHLTELLQEALTIFRNWNPDWKPSCIMVGPSEKEASVVQAVFKGSRLFINDDHRERTWQSWQDDISDGVENKGALIAMMKEIATAPSREEVKKSLEALRESDEAWKADERLQQWFTENWEKRIKQWTVAYRDKVLDLRMNAGHVIDPAHKPIRPHRNSPVSTMIATLLKSYLPDSYRRYTAMNVFSLSNPQAARKLPRFMVNSPNSVKDAIAPQVAMATALDKEIGQIVVTDIELDLYYVEMSSGDRHDVCIGSSDKMPSCSCKYWSDTKLPCRHFFAVVKFVRDVEWKNFSQMYRECPLFQSDRQCQTIEPYSKDRFAESDLEKHESVIEEEEADIISDAEDSDIDVETIDYGALSPCNSPKPVAVEIPDSQVPSGNATSLPDAVASTSRVKPSTIAADTKNVKEDRYAGKVKDILAKLKPIALPKVATSVPPVSVESVSSGQNPNVVLASLVSGSSDQVVASSAISSQSTATSIGPTVAPSQRGASTVVSTLGRIGSSTVQDKPHIATCTQGIPVLIGMSGIPIYTVRASASPAITTPTCTPVLVRDLTTSSRESTGTGVPMKIEASALKLPMCGVNAGTPGLQMYSAIPGLQIININSGNNAASAVTPSALVPLQTVASQATSSTAAGVPVQICTSASVLPTDGVGTKVSSAVATLKVVPQSTISSISSTTPGTSGINTGATSTTATHVPVLSATTSSETVPKITSAQTCTSSVVVVSASNKSPVASSAVVPALGVSTSSSGPPLGLPPPPAPTTFLPLTDFLSTMGASGSPIIFKPLGADGKPLSVVDLSQTFATSTTNSGAVQGIVSTSNPPNQTGTSSAAVTSTTSATTPAKPTALQLLKSKSTTTQVTTSTSTTKSPRENAPNILSHGKSPAKIASNTLVTPEEPAKPSKMKGASRSKKSLRQDSSEENKVIGVKSTEILKDKPEDDNVASDMKSCELDVETYDSDSDPAFIMDIPDSSPGSEAIETTVEVAAWETVVTRSKRKRAAVKYSTSAKKKRRPDISPRGEAMRSLASSQKQEGDSKTKKTSSTASEIENGATAGSPVAFKDNSDKPSNVQNVVPEGEVKLQGMNATLVYVPEKRMFKIVDGSESFVKSSEPAVHESSSTSESSTSVTGSHNPKPNPSTSKGATSVTGSHSSKPNPSTSGSATSVTGSHSSKPNPSTSESAASVTGSHSSKPNPSTSKSATSVTGSHSSKPNPSISKSATSVTGSHSSKPNPSTSKSATSVTGSHSSKPNPSTSESATSVTPPVSTVATSPVVCVTGPIMTATPVPTIYAINAVSVAAPSSVCLTQPVSITTQSAITVAQSIPTAATLSVGVKPAPLNRTIRQMLNQRPPLQNTLSGAATMTVSGTATSMPVAAVPQQIFALPALPVSTSKQPGHPLAQQKILPLPTEKPKPKMATTSTQTDDIIILDPILPKKVPKTRKQRLVEKCSDTWKHVKDTIQLVKDEQYLTQLNEQLVSFLAELRQVVSVGRAENLKRHIREEPVLVESVPGDESRVVIEAPAIPAKRSHIELPTVIEDVVVTTTEEAQTYYELEYVNSENESAIASIQLEEGIDHSGIQQILDAIHVVKQEEVAPFQPP